MFAADLVYSLFAYADMENYLDHPLSHSHKQTLSPSSSTLLRSERICDQSLCAVHSFFKPP
jgi:hypothetical protein